MSFDTYITKTIKQNFKHKIMKKVILGSVLMLALSMSFVSCREAADKAKSATDEAGAAMEQAGEDAKEMGSDAMDKASEAGSEAMTKLLKQVKISKLVQKMQLAI